MRNAAAIVALALCLTVTAAANPSLELRLGSGPAFSSGVTIGVGPEAAPVFDLRLMDARADIDPESVAVTLNRTSIKGFASFNRMPCGARLIVDRRTQNHPDFALGAENRLTFGCDDALGNSYRGEFVLRVSKAESDSRLLLPPGPDTPGVLVDNSDRGGAPSVGLSVSEGRRGPRTARVVAEIRDMQGIRSVVLELNWKEFERIVMQNGFPSRRRGGFRSSRALTGSVQGDSKHLRLDIPIPLQGRETYVGIRAEDVKGAVTSEIVQVRRGKRRRMRPSSPCSPR